MRFDLDRSLFLRAIIPIAQEKSKNWLCLVRSRTFSNGSFEILAAKEAWRFKLKLIKAILVAAGWGALLGSVGGFIIGWITLGERGPVYGLLYGLHMGALMGVGFALALRK